MPDLPGNHPVKHQAKIPQDRPISSSSCCARCLYNIPRGSLMIVLPGLCILLCGILLLILTQTGSWGEGTDQLTLMFLVIGGVLTGGGLVYAVIMWYKHRPEVKKKPSKQSVAPNSVELVGVYNVGNTALEGEDTRPAYLVTGPTTSWTMTVP